MTIVTRPINSNNTIDNGVRSLSPSAEVWDVASHSNSFVERNYARPLARSYRTPARSAGERCAAANNSAQRFEPARERRDNLLLGIMMTAALAVGSIFGGVFNSEDPAPADLAPSAQIAADAAVAQVR